MSMRRSLLFDVDVDLLGLGQHGDGGGGGVDAALRFGLGHALHAVDAAFVLEPRVGAVAADLEHDFLEAALFRLGRAQDLGLPALALGVARVHAVELGGEERRFFAARAGADSRR